MALPKTYGTTFKYGIKGEQLTGLVVETFDAEFSARIRQELLNESGQLVGIRLDDETTTLSISAIVTGTPPAVGDIITFTPGDSEDATTGTKFFVSKVAITGTAGDKLKVKIDAEANQNIPLV